MAIHRRLHRDEVAVAAEPLDECSKVGEQ
jgi:hypothetical protein